MLLNAMACIVIRSTNDRAGTGSGLSLVLSGYLVVNKNCNQDVNIHNSILNLPLFYCRKLFHINKNQLTMKKYFLLLVLLWAVGPLLLAQEQPVGPSIIGIGEYHGLSQPLRDAPILTDEDWARMEEDALKPRNEELRNRSYPFAATALPRGNDPVWQQANGSTQPPRAPIVAFSGQTSPYYPPDANGTIGPNHYMQTINVVYAIYNKSGVLVAGPSNLNTLFSGVTGATYNDGDPVVLYDEMADRWVVCEFSISGSNDYMLMAVSQTNDPTGSWHRYSFDVADMPDYEKMAVWPDGYYMGMNNSSRNDVYVFQRSQMLVGGTAQFMGFDNPNRPTTIDGFMCVPPIDNDGVAAPTGTPGMFITINDDAIGGGSDQLWLYKMTVNWTTPSSSTFARTQQITVPAFDSNFGANWDNIKQPGTTQELDAIPQVIMNAPQYRNFGTYHTIVCCHTVDVDNTDHAGIRWYELRSTDGSTWSLRQSGTYAPDAHSRWMASIRLNGQNEIGLGYSVSSTSVYPGIRYTGQSASAYATGAGVLDLAEQTVVNATTSQTAYNRWGDYSGMSVDPLDDKTFWFTTQYGGSRQTNICSFQVASAPATPDLIVQTPSTTPSSVNDGATTTASCTVKNQGGASAGSSNLKYYLSTDATYSTGDLLLATDAVAALAAGGTAAVSELLTIPAGTSVGTYYILFFADADGAVTEGNENNNVGYVQISVTSSTGSPDLVVQSPATTPLTILAGNTTSASCSVYNQGNAVAAASNLKYYLSTDDTYSSGDTYLATSSIASLSAGASAAAGATLTIPSTTGAGVYYIVFFADADGTVAESNETNNTGSVAITVTVSTTGCNSTTQYPSTTLSVTKTWKTQNYIYAGEFAAFSVVSGRIYHFSYCSADGASASYNSELTLRNKANDAFLAYSNDYCGDDAKIVWTATFTGTVKLVTTVSGCGSNSVSTKLRYKYSTAKEPDDPGINVVTYEVYPNPTTGKVWVESNNGFENVRKIVVYDVSGKIVQSLEISGRPEAIYSFDLGDKAAGYYLVRITGENINEQFKVVLTK